MRVVSVLPSATEIVCALGARRELVGRSSECDFPASVAQLPVVMRPRTLDSARPSEEIDARVQRARASGESLYELDVPLLRTLRPDVLLTQDLCGVCSVTGDEVARACRAAGIEPKVVSVSPRTLEEVWDSVEVIGGAVGRRAEALALTQRLRERASPSLAPPTARVAVLEWLDPPILAGLWTPSMIAAAGAHRLGPSAGETGVRTTWEEVGRLGADLLVLSPCSLSVARTRSELARPAVGRRVQAAVAGSSRVYLADEAYFSRPGPRLADGIELLRGLLSGSNGPWPMPVEPWQPAAPAVAR